MKSLSKKLAALGLAVLMLLTLTALPAFAQATELDTSNNGSATELDGTYFTTLKDKNGGALADPSLTINKYVSLSNNADQPDTSQPIKGVEFKYVKVGNLYEIKYNDANTGVTRAMAYGVSNEFATAVGLTDANADYKYNDNLYFKNGDTILNAVRGKSAADLSSFLNGASVQTGTTDENGSITARLDDTNPWGLYLVVETNVANAKVKTTGNDWEAISITKTQSPFIVALPTSETDQGKTYWNATIVANVKNSTGTADVQKKIVVGDDETETDGTEIVADTDTTSIGDTVHYRLKGTIMDIPTGGQSIDKYVLTDVISAGLTPVVDDTDKVVIIDAVRVTGGDGSITSLEDDDYKVSAPTDYTVGLDTEFTDGKTFTVTMTESGTQKLTQLAQQTGGGEKAVYFYYRARVNENAVIGPNATGVANNSGNPNKVKLTYQVKNSQEMTTSFDTVTHFTFGIDVTKDFEGTAPADVSAVTFKLYSGTTGNETYYTFTEAAVGSYHTPVEVTDEANATELKLDSNKEISLKGLEEGTYYLVETATVGGYNLLKAPVEITIDAVDDGVNGYVKDTENTGGPDYMGTLTAASNIDGKISLTVVNTKGFELPSTGGAGIWMFVIGGVVVIAAGCAYFLMPRKKRQE